MEKTLKLANREVTLFGRNDIKESVPVVFLNTLHGEGRQVYEECQKQGVSDFILAAIEIGNWNHDMSPWAIPPISSKDIRCTGGADDYLQEFFVEILPEIENNLPVKASYYAITGYSLAGLFAIYALYQTDIFSRAASASGSFWYPDFIEYVKTHKLSSNLDMLYFSLGNLESKTGNSILSKVEDNTKLLVDYYKNTGINVFYEENKGNHFRQTVLRMSKGIAHIIFPVNMTK